MNKPTDNAFTGKNSPPFDATSEPSWIKKADMIPAENFRAEPKGRPSSAALEHEGPSLDFHGTGND